MLWDLHQRWRQIAHACVDLDEMALMDVASRIASSLAYSEMRLLDLVEAYGAQLRGRCHAAKPDRYARFKDTNSFAVYKAIHALFWEMAVLRDSLAEFASKFCFSRADITSLAGLVRSLRKNTPAELLAQEILTAADDTSGGWLAIFTAYRNLFTHYAPMEQAAGTAYAIQEMQNISGVTLPVIYYPLPSNAADLMRRRASGEPLFSTFKQMAEASAGHRPDRASEPDALEYLYDCLAQMARLAQQLGDRSPIAAKPFHFGPDDIIGGAQVIRR